MKQAFVTVGHWTLRAKDVSGVSVVPMTRDGWPDPDIGWTVRILSFGQVVTVANCQGKNALAHAQAWEEAIHKAIGSAVRA